MSPQLVLHPRVADPGTLRVWLAAVDFVATPELEWLLDGVPAVPTVRRALAPVQPTGGTPGALRSRTGIVEFGPLDPGSQHRVEVRAAGTPLTSGELVTRLLPDRVPGADQPAGFDAGFSIMIVSCYDQATDKQGQLGVVLSQLPADQHPDLVILMGDQVYLDNPVLTLPHVTVDPFAAAFEDKYLRNWTVTPPQTHGYADLLDLAPVVAIPDDHDYWNNFPFPFAAAPGTWADGGHGPWTAAANALLDAFQRDVAGEHSRVVDVDPLSIFLMDNRTNRTTHYDQPTTSASDHTLFDGWVQGLVDGAQRGDDTVPVLVTGPSLLQPAKGRLARTLDANLTNYDDYRWIMGQVQRLQQAGRPVLLLTGDVHYPRIGQADGGLVGDGELLEAISSPSSLVGIPGLDQAAGLAGRVSRFFGGPAGLRWPKVQRLADPDNAPPISPQPAYRDVYPDGRPGEVGDHVALLTFRRDDPAVRVSVTYVMVPKPDNPDVARVGVDAGTFTLTPRRTPIPVT